MFNRGRLLPNSGHSQLPQAEGYSLIEVLITVIIIGILAALIPPFLWGTNKPTQNATARVEGIMRQVRMRAISSTTAYRVRRLSPTRLQVEAASTRGCEAFTQLSAPANSGDTTITVGSTRGFGINDQIRIGSETNLTILSINEGAQTITVTPAMTTTQPTDSPVELNNNWQSGNLVTTFTEEDLTLPTARTQSQRIQLANTPANWTLCFDSRGLATLFNPTTGLPLNGNLNLSIERVDATTNVRVPSSQVGTVTVFQGGGVNANTQALDE